jgi:hypothetical protein
MKKIVVTVKTASQLKPGDFVVTNQVGDGFSVVDIVDKGKRKIIYDFAKPHIYNPGEVVLVEQVA